MIVRVAVLQMSSGTDVEENLVAAEELLGRAAESGARYALTPEYTTYYGPAAGYAAAAQAIPGPATERLGALARRLDMAVHIGSMLETGPQGRCFNTSVLLDRKGEVVSRYRKAHLFDVEVAGEVSFRESAAIAPGDEQVLAEVEGHCWGLTICFDLRFPELYLSLARQGAEVITAPAAFTAATGQPHWETLVRARALDSQTFVLAAAQAVSRPGVVATWGHAMIVGPWGEVVAEAPRAGEAVLVAEIDLGEVARRRSQINLQRLARRDLR